MQNVRPTATSFTNIVRNLVNDFHNRETGYWSAFMAGSAPINFTVADGRMFLYLDDSERDWNQSPVCREAIAVIPNTDEYEPEQWDVIGSRMFEGRNVVLASFKGVDAALGFALERVCARNWYAGAQDVHDPVAD